MEVAFRIVDVFADGPLAGNQLCVVPDASALDRPQMLAIAREMGFSESTFVSEAAGDRYRMRIFTPAGELPFAGHPTLGTAFVLVSEGTVSTPLVQEVEAGDIAVDVSVERNFAWMRQLPPVFGPELGELADVAEAVGISRRDLHPELPPQVVSTGLPHVLVPAASVTAVEHARPDDRALTHLIEEVDADGCYLFALSDGQAVARMFSPEHGVVEDAATGSAAGPLGAYLASRGAGRMPGGMKVHQGAGLGRPSTLHVEVESDGGHGWRVAVGGGVHVVASGAFHL
jgi:trans-2,3-dihydro-3-hydroxyanthranilate isomerase